MQPDKFTIKSQEALQAAQQLAEERRNPQTMPEHLLAVLLEQDGGVVAPVLRKLGVDPAAVRQALALTLEGLPKLATSGGREEPAGGSSEIPIPTGRVRDGGGHGRGHRSSPSVGQPPT